ncbi:uncharacterized protein ARMOST_15108 [Armillaria ostoyae]|uniref:Uncharacterized protein n=1 Tax=Armillaria ostoyae TaxID=47428 RepID=A0A284RSI0_ARMOS|nr:uncharacterized protein ARMOST_15108 [Armillaria ostoyae]
MSSTKEAPESYLAILASSPELHEKDTHRTTDNERPMLTLLDALAGICVSQAEREVYASAIATAPESCTIFLIGNHEEVPQETQDYLTDICQKLTAIANLVDTSGSRAPSIEDLPPKVRDSIGDVYRSVFLFTFTKFYTRLTKWDAMWTRRLKDITHRLVDESDKKKFQDLTGALDTLHHLASDFHTGDADLLLEVLEAIARNWKLSDLKTVAFIKRVDLLPTSDQTNAPFLVEQYLRKVLKTYNETTKLIRFVVSPRRGHIFRNQPKLVFLRSEKRRVELDIKTAIGTLKRQMDLTDEDEIFLDGFVDDTGTIDLPKLFVVTEAHNSLCLPWVSPDLTSINPGLHAAVQKHMMVLVQAASVAHVRSRRRYSESTTHSSEEEGMLPWKSSLEDVMRKVRARMDSS